MRKALQQQWHPNQEKLRLGVGEGDQCRGRRSGAVCARHGHCHQKRNAPLIQISLRHSGFRQDLQKWRYRSNLSPEVNQVDRHLGRSVELRHSHVQRLRAGAAADRGLAVIERSFVDHVHLELNRRTRIVDMQCTQLEMELHSFRDNMLGPIIFRSDIPLMIFQR